MEIGDLLGLGASALSGGVFGIIGVALKMGASWLAERQKIEARKLELAHELALYDKQAQLKTVEAENEIRVADAQLRGKSYDVYTDTKGIYRWAATAISLTRVALTTGLWVLVGLIFWKLTRASIPYVNSADLIKEIVMGTVFCASSATLWWFGDRPPKKT